MKVRKSIFMLTLLFCLLTSEVIAKELSNLKIDIKYGTFNVKSSAFNSGDTIPKEYVCTKIPGGKNLSIPIEWSGAPVGTKSFAVFMYDLNPVAKNFVHWAIINIPYTTYELKAGASGSPSIPNGSIELKNTKGTTGYTGPCPPSGTGKHQYKIMIFALNIETLTLPENITLKEFKSAIHGNLIAETELSGYFEQ